MDKINILNKIGMLTPEDRKQPLSHGCSYFNFSSCIDLSEPIIITPYGMSAKQPLSRYSQDIASFIVWWTKFVLKDLNGFSGFSNVKFICDGFELINDGDV